MSESEERNLEAREPEPKVLQGVLVLRGENTPDEFDVVVANARDFLGQGGEDAPTDEWLKSEVSDAVYDRSDEISPNTVLVARNSLELTHFATKRFHPFRAIITSGGMLSHGFIVTREMYDHFWGRPKDFIAASNVDGVEFLKTGEEVRFIIEGRVVKILRQPYAQ